MSERPQPSRLSLILDLGTRRCLSLLAAASGEPETAVLRRLIREACRRQRLEVSAPPTGEARIPQPEELRRVAGYRVTVRHVRSDPEEATLRAWALRTALARALSKPPQG